MVQPRQTLIVMVKEPNPGRVKTRLGRDIGMVPAAWWFRHQVADLLRRIEDPRWDIVLAVSPDHKGMTSRVWPALNRRPQGQGDLGDRMGRLLGQFAGKTCLIGSDIPGIERPMLADAFKTLHRCDVVFGPSDDGGFWLVGTRKVPQGLFQNVRWSTEHALADSLASVKGQRTERVNELSDVDTVHDLAMTSPRARATAKP